MSMSLLHSTLLDQRTAISSVVFGHFSGAKNNELVVQRCSKLELLQIASGKLQCVASVDTFGVIRKLCKIAGGQNGDMIAVGSDSGKCVILAWNSASRTFVKVLEHTYGKPGCLRRVPGQYVAADPYGRAVMFAAIESAKLAYGIAPDRSKFTATAEFNKPSCIVYDLVAMEVLPNQSPVFAAIEADYSIEQNGKDTVPISKKLAFYEFDIGQNRIAEVHTMDIDESAYALIAVPGGTTGPGGVLVCSLDKIAYVHPNLKQPIMTRIPRRGDVTFANGDGTVINAHTIINNSDGLTILVQTEFGDLFTVRLVGSSRQSVDAINVNYFDSIPPATAIVAMDDGYFFSASEVGNQYLYKLAGMQDAMDVTYQKENQDPNDPNTYFMPRPLTNLTLEDEMQSLAPITDFVVENLLKRDRPQLYMLTGAGTRSTLRILNHGLGTTQFSEEINLPPERGNPVNIWTVKRSIHDKYDSYMVISFVNSTMVFSIGERVEEVKNTGIHEGAQTLHVSLLGDEILQVYPDAVRRIRPDGKPTEWKPPGNRKILHACSNSMQVVLAVSGGDVYYLQEGSTEAEKLALGPGKEITALALQPSPSLNEPARYFAVCDTSNQLKIVDIESQGGAAIIHTRELSKRVCSLALAQLSPNMLLLGIGTVDGIFIRTQLNMQTGKLGEFQSKIVGNPTTPVRLAVVTTNSQSTLLVMASTSWLCYNHRGFVALHTLNAPPLVGAASLSFAGITDGVVALSGNSLHLFSIETLGEPFHQYEVPLKQTPRAIAVHPIYNKIITIETAHNAYNEEEKKRLGAGCWASHIRVLDPLAATTHDLVTLPSDEAALSLCLCAFADHAGEYFVCVGTAKELVLQPRRKAKGGSIRVYKLNPITFRLELVCQKPTENIPGALCSIQGRLLAGVGHLLRIYDLSKRKQQLVRKCECRQLPNEITAISACGDRIFVADAQESVRCVQYSRVNNSLDVFCDDIVPRWIIAQTLLDPSTVAVSDKFGNVHILRLPEKLVISSEDPAAARLDELYRNSSTSYKLDAVVSYYIGEPVTKLAKAKFAPNAPEVLLYVTILGRVGALIPFTTRAEVEFFSRMELLLRIEQPPLCGREHLAYRSYYVAARSVVDGDLCEQFPLLPEETQQKIAKELDTTVPEIIARLEKIRSYLERPDSIAK